MLLSTVVCSILQLDKPAKGTQCCRSIATMNIFILLTGTSTPTTIKIVRIVAFPWHKWLGERFKSVLFAHFRGGKVVNVLVQRHQTVIKEDVYGV